MRHFILMAVAIITLSACSAGSSSINRVNYQAPDSGLAQNYESSKISPYSCYSDELMSLNIYTDLDRSSVTCNND